MVRRGPHKSVEDSAKRINWGKWRLCQTLGEVGIITNLQKRKLMHRKAKFKQ